MEQVVKVRQTFMDGTAQVVLIRQSACAGDCHKCSGCGAAQETLMLQAQNPIGAQPGDKVVIQSATGPVLKSAVVLYMLPLVLFFLGYAFGSLLWGLGPLVGGIAFTASIGLVVVYDRRVLAKMNTVYTITGYAGDEPPAVSTKRGD